MICACCGEVKNDTLISKYCKKCWLELNNEREDEDED
jgi:hypothetical protein